MGLRILKLVTECHVPRRYRSDAEVVDRLAHGRFAADLASHLGPSLSRQPEIVRIRHLPVRVIIPGSELNEDSLSKAWTEAFSRALFTALAYPTGAGPFEVFRASSVAAFVADAIGDLLAGTAAGKWQYAEFEEIFRTRGSHAAFALLCEWPHLTVPILLELLHSGTLDRLLARFDEVAMERVFALLSRPEDAEPLPLSIADLTAAARLALTHVPEKLSALRSRQYALRLFVEARRRGEPIPSPRAVFQSMFALSLVVTAGLPAPTDVSDEGSFPPGGSRYEIDGERLPPAIAALLERIGRERQARPQAPVLARLNELLTELRIELRVPPPSDKAPRVRWISSDWCGLFFLSGTLNGLGWVTAWRRLSQFQTGGISCLLAGLALAITENFDPAPRALEAGVALFSGYSDEPDLFHLHRVFQERGRDVRLEVLHAAFPRDGIDDAAESWSATFEKLSERLLRTFAAGIRGFRQTTTHGIVRTFIERSGRIRVESERIVVAANPSPFHVALHIAGMDMTIESISWLGGRRLEFEIGDL